MYPTAMRKPGPAKPMTRRQKLPRLAKCTELKASGSDGAVDTRDGWADSRDGSAGRSISLTGVMVGIRNVSLKCSMPQELNRGYYYLVCRGFFWLGGRTQMRSAAKRPRVSSRLPARTRRVSS